MVLHAIDQTLAEQLQINEREIAQRKELLNFTQRDAEILKDHKLPINEYIDAIVNQFYDYQSAVPAIALLIGDAETLRRLKSAMRNYILELFDGYYDSEYVNRRLRIGKIHKRIGVSPKLYIAAIYQLHKILSKAIEMYYIDNMDNKESRELFDALNKVIMFDIQLVFDTYISSLVSEVESAKEELEDYALVLEHQVAERTEQLANLAIRDELTGLFNQRGMYEHLRRELARAERIKDILSLAYFDLNGFKQLNDNHGHQAGDELLELVGKVLQESIREIDQPCRYGGDEFCIILPDTEISDAVMVVERFIENYKKQTTTSVSFSVGICSTVSPNVDDMDSLIKQADSLMYQAKKKARKKPGFYIETGEKT
mgnify:CR=1 FL=1